METHKESNVLTPKLGFFAAAAILLCNASAALAGEAELILPDLKSVKFFGDKIDGASLLMWGLVICAFGIVFGIVQYSHIKKMKVHKAMLDISELIYGTCKTYLLTQGKFIVVLWALVAVIMWVYFHILRENAERHGGYNPRMQFDRYRRQLHCCVVRNENQYLCKFTLGLRELARQTLPGLRNTAQIRYEHRYAADQYRAVRYALHPSVHRPAIRRLVLHWLCNRRIIRRIGAENRRRRVHQNSRHRLRS